MKIKNKAIIFKNSNEEIDNINSPSHYNKGKYETIDIIDSIGGEGVKEYYRGNIIKYLARYEFKNGIEDLKKAQWYLDRLISKCQDEFFKSMEEK